MFLQLLQLHGQILTHGSVAHCLVALDAILQFKDRIHFFLRHSFCVLCSPPFGLRSTMRILNCCKGTKYPSEVLIKQGQRGKIHSFFTNTGALCQVRLTKCTTFFPLTGSLSHGIFVILLCRQVRLPAIGKLIYRTYLTSCTYEDTTPDGFLPIMGRKRAERSGCPLGPSCPRILRLQLLTIFSLPGRGSRPAAKRRSGLRQQSGECRLSGHYLRRTLRHVLCQCTLSPGRSYDDSHRCSNAGRRIYRASCIPLRRVPSGAGGKPATLRTTTARAPVRP